MAFRTPSLMWAGGYTINKLQTNQRPLEADNGEYYIPFIIRWSAYQLAGGAYSSIGFDIGSVSGRKPTVDFIRSMMVDNSRNPLGIIITFPDTYYTLYVGPGEGPRVYPVFTNQKTFGVFMQPQDIYTGLAMPTAAQTLIIVANGNIPPITESNATAGSTIRMAPSALDNTDANLITLSDDSVARLNFLQILMEGLFPPLTSSAVYVQVNGQTDPSKCFLGFMANIDPVNAYTYLGNVTLRYEPSRPNIFFKKLDLHKVTAAGVNGGVIVSYGFDYVSGLGEVPP